MQKVRSYKTGVLIGDYVLVTKYNDRDPNDPWSIGFLRKKGEDQIGQLFSVYHDEREYRHCWRIAPSEGDALLEQYKFNDILSK